jgi:hypothetical protein
MDVKYTVKGRDGSVGMATGYGLEVRGSIADYSSLQGLEGLRTTRPPVQWVSGPISSWLKRPECAAGCIHRIRSLVDSTAGLDDVKE